MHLLRLNNGNGQHFTIGFLRSNKLGKVPYSISTSTAVKLHSQFSTILTNVKIHSEASPNLL